MVKKVFGSTESICPGAIHSVAFRSSDHPVGCATPYTWWILRRARDFMFSRSNWSPRKSKVANHEIQSLICERPEPRAVQRQTPASDRNALFFTVLNYSNCKSCTFLFRSLIFSIYETRGVFKSSLSLLYTSRHFRLEPRLFCQTHPRVSSTNDNDNSTIRMRSSVEKGMRL